jgi:hypothetical protein
VFYSHACVENAFQLLKIIRSSFDWLDFVLKFNWHCLKFQNWFIYMALPLWSSIFFFLKLSKCLNSCLKCSISVAYCLLNNISPIYLILSLVLTLTFQPIKNVLTLHLFLKQI